MSKAELAEENENEQLEKEENQARGGCPENQVQQVFHGGESD